MVLSRSSFEYELWEDRFSLFAVRSSFVIIMSIQNKTFNWKVEIIKSSCLNLKSERRSWSCIYHLMRVNYRVIFSFPLKLIFFLLLYKSSRNILKNSNTIESRLLAPANFKSQLRKQESKAPNIQNDHICYGCETWILIKTFEKKKKIGAKQEDDQRLVR